MPAADKIAKEIKLDERNHVEKPLLDQLIWSSPLQVSQ